MNLELTILQILALSDGFLMPKGTLVAEVRLRDMRPTLAEIESAMRRLEDADQATGISNPDAAGGSKWKIADAGKARLAEAGLL